MSNDPSFQQWPARLNAQRVAFITGKRTWNRIVFHVLGPPCCHQAGWSKWRLTRFLCGLSIWTALILMVRYIRYHSPLHLTPQGFPAYYRTSVS